jgi:hypothetical protein
VGGVHFVAVKDGSLAGPAHVSSAGRCRHLLDVHFVNPTPVHFGVGKV